MKALSLSLLFASALAQAASAQGSCPMTYGFFELAVPHLDLGSCPAGLGGEGRFCRATVGGDAVHVYVFASGGEQCLLATKSLASGEYQLSVK